MQASPAHYSSRDRASSVMMPVEIREGAMAMLEVKPVLNLVGNQVSAIEVALRPLTEVSHPVRTPR